MATTSVPLKVLTDPDALKELSEGLANATAATLPPSLYDAMGQEDRRYDELCDRAVATILQMVAGMLDDAIAAEWERAPITVEWHRVAKAVPA